VSDAEVEQVLSQLRTAHRVAGIGSWATSLRSADEPYDMSPEVRSILDWRDDRPPTFRDLAAMVHPDDRPNLLEARAAAIAGDRPYRIDLRLVRVDGSTRHVHLAGEVARDDDGTPQRLVGVLQDRTEEVESLRRLRVTEASRRQLLQRLLDTADRERERLARQLELGTIAELDAVEADMAAAIDDASPEPWREALDAVRRSIASLRGTLSTIADAGARSDLAAVVADLVADQPGLDVRAEVDVPSPPAPAIRSVALRVVQEALQNARKHADAATATVSVRADDEAVLVLVEDDGTGFDVDAVAAPGPLGHFGLASLREDVAAVGGTFDVSSGPGGTSVRARLPRR